MTESVNRSVDRSVHRSLDRVSFRDPTYGRTDGLTENLTTYSDQTSCFVTHTRVRNDHESQLGTAALRASQRATLDAATGAIQ